MYLYSDYSLIITCIESGRQYIPSMEFYKLDSMARMFMVVNSSINFLIYCAVSSAFQVSYNGVINYAVHQNIGQANSSYYMRKLHE